MRHSYFLALLLALVLPLAAHAQQPFERFGVKVKILTLTNGRYPEFFDNDSLRRIGTVVYDTRLERVAYLLPPDSLVGRLESDITARFISVDPLAEKDAHITPYAFARNNALRYKDPDGRQAKDIIITGDKSKEALAQLQAATSLKLSMDESGKVAATGKAKTDADKNLQAAVNSTSVTVRVNATSSNTSANGRWFVGGAFGGSEVKDGKTLTTQTVNPNQMQKLDAVSGNRKGSAMMHEVLESYFGGVDSPGSPAPTFDPGSTGFSNYQNAHNKAKAADPRFTEPNVSEGPNGEIFINKFPYNPALPPALNPDVLMFNKNNPNP